MKLKRRYLVFSLLGIGLFVCVYQFNTIVAVFSNLAPSGHQSKDGASRKIREKLRTVKTIRFIVEQSYEAAELDETAAKLDKTYELKEITPCSKGCDMPLDDIRELVKAAGFELVEGDTDSFDASLRLKIKGLAVPRYYERNFFSGQTYYTGAIIEGGVSIERLGETILSRQFTAKREPPTILLGLDTLKNEPSGNLFREVFDDEADSYLIFVDIISKGWEVSRGVDALITLLRRHEEYGYWNVRRNAAYALGEIGDGRAVEPLIAALRDEDDRVVDAAAEALGQLRDSRAIDPLLRTFLARKRDSWRAAYVSLGEFADKHLIEILEKELSKDADGNDDLRQLIAEAKQRMESHSESGQILPDKLQEDLLDKVIERRTFHVGDRVQIKAGVKARYIFATPSQTGHDVPVVGTYGITGTVLKGGYKELIIVTWDDKQIWEENHYDHKKVMIQSFTSVVLPSDLRKL